MENSTLMMADSVSKILFSWYDYILFSVMLGVSAVIGVYFGCFGTKQATADEYLMGDKKMKVFPISMSLVASHISGITLLGLPADVYRFGATYWLFIPVSVIVATVTIKVYLPVFYKLQITSTYEYLERRFDNTTRVFASFLFTVNILLYLPIVIYLPALAFSAATGINVHYITPLVCGVCIFYTTLGGLKAVVWTDTIQFTVTIGAVVTVFFLGVKSAGGFGVVWARAAEGRRLDVFDFDPDPTKRDSFWIIVIGLTFHWLASFGVHQSCVQKFLSVSTFRESKLSVIFFWLGIIVICSLCIFTGLIMYSKYATCDPFATGAVQKNDQLLPYYIMDVASHIPGLSGLFMAGIFSAALSTLSASLNCLAGTMFEDFILKCIGSNKTSEKTSTYILKLLVLVIGVTCTVMVFIMEHLGGILPLAISLGGVTSGPLLAMFTIGLLLPKASSKGTLYGSVVGLVFSGWVVFTAQYYQARGLLVYEAKPTSVAGCSVNSTITSTEHLLNHVERTAEDEIFFLFRISYYYYSVLGFAVTVLFAVLFSYVFENNDPPVHRDLLSPVIYPLLSDEETIRNEQEEEDYSPKYLLADNPEEDKTDLNHRSHY